MNIESLREKIQAEGDRKLFTYKGYQCKIRRHNALLHLCGYVKLPESSPFYEKDYGTIEEMTDYDIPAHGGLTFAGFDRDGDYIIGFDCAHAWDIVPQMVFDRYQTTCLNDGVYRDMDYVTTNLEELVDCLIEYEASHG